MTRITQFGIAALILCAANTWGPARAWSQEELPQTPVDAAAVNGQPVDADSPVVGGPVFAPFMEVSDVPGNPIPEMIETSSPPIPGGMLVGEIERFHYGRCYVSELGSPTNSCCLDGTCRSPECGYCHRQPMGRLARFKDHMQRSHWGYCNYFDERPFGESVHSTLSQQIQRGLADSMMLYHYDFYPEDSEHAAELTPRGRTQLMKIIDRMQDQPAAIRIQIAESQQSLNQGRRQHVVNALAMMGANVPDQLVVLAPVRHSGSAVEAGLIYQNQVESVISRGRIIQATGTTRFGGR